MKNIPYQHSLFALGTTWWFEIYDHVSQEFFDSLIINVKNRIRQFEKDYSRFLTDSLISQLNDKKVLKNPPEELVEIFKESKRYYELSDGVFNIAVGAKLESIGYDKDYSFKIKNEELKVKNWEKEVLHVSDLEIRISDLSRIDLGGIGKGWLVDRVAELLKDEGAEYFFVNAGGDIHATSNHNKPIEFALENPFDTSESIGKIQLMNQGIAASSSNRRRWKDDKTGKTYSHIIDTSNIEKENPRVGVFTQAKDTTTADVVSTILFICPIEKVEEYAKKFDVEWMLVFEDGSYTKSKGYKGLLNL